MNPATQVVTRAPLITALAGAGLIAALAGARQSAVPQPAKTPRPHVSGEAPRPPTDLRRRNSIVMDVDFDEWAAVTNSDIIDIAGTLQLILDRIAAQTAPTNDFGEPRSIVGEGRFAPYFLSLTLAVINNYSTLQANIGAHDPNNLRLLALFRLVGNIPGAAVPPPAPGTVTALMQSCTFGADPDGVIRLHCPS